MNIESVYRKNPLLPKYSNLLSVELLTCFFEYVRAQFRLINQTFKSVHNGRSYETEGIGVNSRADII